jgi:non-heme chloroperoxidase
MRRAGLLGGAAVVVGLAARRVRELAELDHELDEMDSGSLPAGRSLTVTTDDGARLAVTVAGPDDGAAVVLAHCWLGSRAVWGPVAHRLVAGHRVVLYDQRGHGASESSVDAPSIPVLGHDLRAVLEAVDVIDAVLVGHSMGGMSVQSYAAEHPTDFAERVRGVVLVATAARVHGRALPPALVEWLMGERSSDWHRRGRVGRAVARGALGRDAHRLHVDLTLEGLTTTTGAARAGFLTAMSGMDLRGGLGDLAVPTAVLVGTGDRLTPPRLARQLATGIREAELVVLPDAGHMLPLETPDQIVQAIGAVIERSRRAGDDHRDVTART